MSRIPRGWSSWLVLGLIVALVASASAGLITKPYTFSPGTSIKSAEVNSNFDTAYNAINGGLDDANVSSLSESKTVFSATGHAHSGGTGGAPVQWVDGTNITAASSITIPTDGNFFTVTGNTTINALSSRSSGVFAVLYFTGTPTITHDGTSLILFGATSYTVTAGDVLTFKSLGSGNWRQVAGPNTLLAGTGITITRGPNIATAARVSQLTNFSSVQLVRKTADETVNNSSTLQNDDALLAALAASEVVTFQCTLFYVSGATPDFKAAFTVPSGTILWGWAGNSILTTADAAGYSTAAGASGSALSIGGSGGTVSVMLSGVAANGATPGNLQLQWAQDTANASDTKVLANSFCLVNRI